MFKKAAVSPAQPVHAKTCLSSGKAAGLLVRGAHRGVREHDHRPRTPMADPAPSQGHAFSTVPSSVDGDQGLKSPYLFKLFSGEKTKFHLGAGPCATESCEPRQVRKEATVSGQVCVPQDHLAPTIFRNPPREFAGASTKLSLSNWGVLNISRSLHIHARGSTAFNW